MELRHLPLPASHPSWQQIVVRYGQSTAGAIAGLIGAIWLGAWALGMPQAWVATPAMTMKTNTALGAILAGTALFLLRPAEAGARRRWAGAILAVVVLLIGSLTLGEHLFHRDFRIDQLLFRVPAGAAGLASPNRMGPPTAFCLILIGAGLLTLWSGRKRLAPYLGVIVCLIGIVPAVGYVYGAASLYSNAHLTGIAWTTVPALIVLGMGVILASPEQGPMALLLRPDAGGALLRHLLPATFLLPVLLGYLRAMGERQGLFGTSTGRALFVLCIILVFTALLWISASRLSSSAAKEEEARGGLRHLSAIVESSDDAIYGIGLDGTIVSWNPAAQRLYGYSPGEIVGRPLDTLIPADHPSELQRNLQQLARGERIEQYETTRRCKNGRLLAVAVKISPIRNEAGEIVGASVIARDIAERKRAEESLRESEGRLRLFIEHAPAALAMFDREMRYMAASRRWLQDYGLDPNILGRSHYEVFPDLPGHWKTIHQRGLAGEVLSADADAFARADGSVQWIKWAVHPWYNGLGKVGGILIAAEDVTSRVQTQQALQRSEARLSAALGHLTEGVVIATQAGEFFYWNPAAQKMHGFPTAADGFGTAASLVNTFNLRTGDGRVLPVDDWPLPRILRGEELRNLELHVSRADQGWERTFSYSGSMQETATGERLAFLSIYDLTEQRKAERALQESEARFRAVAENIPQMIWVTDDQGGVLYLSSKWAEYTDTPIQQSAPDWCTGAIHPDDQQESSAMWRAAVSAHRPYEAEYRLRGRDGEYRWHLVRAVPITDRETHATMWFGTTTDIQDQKRAQEALIRSEKLASVGRMAATVAHEINNPLAMIVNAVYIASLDTHLSERARTSLATAEQELERVAHMTRQTLGFYRENAAPTDIDPSELVQDVVQLYRPKFLHRDIGVESEHKDKLQIHAIAGEIRQVVSNILANAIDASPRGGRMRIRTSRAQINGIGYVRLTFADTGEGISTDNMKRIFEPFFTTKEAVGTGLGLWVSSEIVRRHHGTIRVHSRRGQGTVFSIFLPEALHQKEVHGDNGEVIWQRAS